MFAITLFDLLTHPVDAVYPGGGVLHPRGQSWGIASLGYSWRVDDWRCISLETPGVALGVVASPGRPELVFLGDAVGLEQPVCFWVVLHYRERGTVSLGGVASLK